MDVTIFAIFFLFLLFLVGAVDPLSIRRRCRVNRRRKQKLLYNRERTDIMKPPRD